MYKTLVGNIKSLESDSSLWVQDKWVEGIREIAKNNNWKDGDVFMMLRIMVYGQAFSPPLFEFMQIVGKDFCLKNATSSEQFINYVQ